MSKTIKRNSARVTNQDHRGRRLRRGEKRELERLMASGVEPATTGWTRSDVIR
ncbi:hypothetical protein PBI_WOES_89 [Gordonia phage Woes]|nr:hypothetical protein BH793_gp24 [Gordonia phage Woes]QAX94372.1 hypothetical protein SEA_GUILLAUME_89 [Gordonia phage Guillaume]QAX94695.1 hypothetical protein SEA_HARAMBE_89 [Gordonia phage Harambe]QAX95358.1 hypothetical protein SEA_HELLO_89 [Gordonia phage Hello]QAX95450.1 hypothetical protein SEA_NEOEVIE_89 [Gordonia phage Neoevie]QBP30366.1 hypothetical protein SEA_JORMUNGANDR_89 [Gordonia phage Jormungandr]QBP31864.1 hypothetical protein SEA_NIMI13_89 [Gordonia phage Nimi13]QDF16948